MRKLKIFKIIYRLIVKIFIFLVIILILQNKSYSQNKNLFVKDNINNLYENIIFYIESNPDSAKVLLQEFEKTINSDSILCKYLYLKSEYFYKKDNIDSTIVYLDSTCNIAQKISNKDYALYLKTFGDFYQDESFYYQAINYYEKALEMFKTEKLYEEQANILMEIGNINHFQGNYSSSLLYFQKALKYYENTNNTDYIAQCYNNIGMVHETQSNYEKAIEYFDTALELYMKIPDSLGYSRTLNNKGICLGQIGEFEKAKFLFMKALDIDQKINDFNGIGLNYMNLGNIKYFENKVDTALEYWNLAYDYNIKAKDFNNATICLNNLAYVYYELGKYNKAIGIFEEIIEKSKISGSKDNIQLAYQNLAEIYSNQGNYKKAYEFSNISNEYSDSLVNEDIKKELFEIEAKYEAEKKAQLIELQNIQIEKQKSELKIETGKKYAFVIGFILMIIFSIFILIIYYNKRKANQILIEKNAEINNKQEEIKSQSESLQVAYNEISNQKNQIEIQKIDIENKNKDILSSIEYAQKIQNAILLNFENPENIFKEYFIYFKPRDIVSGDFYFFKKLEKKIIFGVSDCTGHGVPAAFMSILGVTFLNEIIDNKKFSNSSDALNLLRYKIKQALQQTGKKNEQKDGMDISFCIYDIENNEIEYSGANLPIIIFRNSTNELVELKPDRQPIGIFLKEEPFTIKKETIFQNDVIYLYSDGYYSQFGGEEYETFKTKRFKELILNIGKKNLKTQFDIFSTTLINWQSDTEQIDDILVIGLKLS